ncbi:uncharacterized protein LOC110973075 isoform X2 [Acanthaster planci]|nr:uncharacterized protein LOC110973075 isoform X2 [Acanthaster planci]
MVSVRADQEVTDIAGSVSNVSECVWKVTPPAGTGTRIAIEVAESRGSSLRIGDGYDPSLGTPILSTAEVLIPRTAFSTESALWITTGLCTYAWRSYRLQFTIWSYTSIDCDDNQYSCPSGTKCLEPASVCNGIHECPSYADEMQCNSCKKDEFACSADKCIPRDAVCNQQSNCEKLNDEFSCGFCREPNIELNASVKHFSTEGKHNYNCLWTVTAEPTTRILARLLTRGDSLTTFCDGNYRDYVRQIDVNQCTKLAQLSIRPTSGAVAFRRHVVSSGSTMWIESTSVWDDPGSYLTMTLEQFVGVECQSEQFKCPSGTACIDQSAVCDGWPDCLEFEDEFGCRGCCEECLACGPSECVPRLDICDGVSHCQDHTDEFNCGPCGDTRINVTGPGYANLTSPGWPGNYPSNLRCYWVAIAPQEKRNLVIFLEFDTQSGYDYLKLSNGIQFSQGLKVSGKNFPSRMASKGNELSLHFFSNYNDGRKGFLLQLEQRPADQISCGAGEVLCDYQYFVCVPENTAGQRCPQNNCGEETITVDFEPVDFLSPKYPDKYPAELACTWTITTAEANVIFVHVKDFQTEPSHDVLKLKGQTFYSASTSQFSLDGKTKVRSVVFNSSSIVIEFISDSASGGKFHLSLQSNFSSYSDEVPCNVNNDSLIDCQDGSCVTSDARCNGFFDCKNRFDEQHCNVVHCPDFYACSESTKCILLEEVCDGVPNCDLKDDEEDCGNKRCPPNCNCGYENEDFVVRCRQGWNLDTIANVAKKTKALEISYGEISTLELGVFKGLPYLQALSLENNSIEKIEQRAFDGLNITFLDISGTNITSIDLPIFEELDRLETLMMINVPITFISENAFSGLSNLRTIVIITNQKDSSFITIEREAVWNLKSLQNAYVDDYRLCCDFAVLEHFSAEDGCITTELQPPLNLCGSLLQTELLRVAMWVLGFSALLGNVVAIIWRLKGTGDRCKKTHSFMVMNLAVSDFMMGVYMVMVAAADLSYGETYFRVASQWRSSVVCKIAGVISVMSSEASVFFVTLISIDCFLCIVFPFSRIHLRERSTKIVVSLLWLVAICLSVVPTFSVGPDSDLYGLSDVCIGLPFTTKSTGQDNVKSEDIPNPLGSQQLTLIVGTDKKPAWILSVVVFLGVNLVCFLVVFCCYVAIFVSVRRTSKMVRKSSHRNREIKMAVKMALIVGTDFACWMPVIIMGILSQTNTIEIGADMYGWIVVFILPINSSLNPYLYTIYTACMPPNTSNGNNTSHNKPDKRNPKIGSVETLDIPLSDLKRN